MKAGNMPGKILLITAMVLTAFLALVPLFFYIVVPPGGPSVVDAVDSNPTGGTRGRAVTWITRNLTPGSILLVPRELRLDTRALERDYPVWRGSYRDMGPGRLRGLAALLGNAHVLAPKTADRQMKQVIHFDGAPVPEDYFLYPPRVENPGIGIFRPADGVEDGENGENVENGKNGGVRELPVWNRRATDGNTVSPALIVASQRGKFAFDFSVDQTGPRLTPRLTVTCTAGAPDGRTYVNFGYEINRRGLNMPMPRGQYLYLVLWIDGSDDLVEPGTYMFITDQEKKEKKWDVTARPFSSPRPRLYVLVKKIRPGAQRLRMGVHFAPANGGKLVIRDARVVVSPMQWMKPVF